MGAEFWGGPVALGGVDQKFCTHFVCQTGRIAAVGNPVIRGRTERAAMKTRMCACGLLAAAVSVMVLTGGTGVAHADSDPFGTPGPGLIDQLVTSTPALSVDPADEGGPSVGSDGVGMYCENRFARCR